MIVLVSVVCTLPFSWDVPWRILWSYRKIILWVFIVPNVFQIIQNVIMKKCLFKATTITQRALASIFIFWQTCLSIIAGVSSAIVRFVIAILGVVISMPQLFE